MILSAGMETPMKTYKVEGIGPLDLNPDAHGLADRLKVLRICSFVIFAPMAFYTWTYSQRHEDVPYAVTIPCLVCLVAAVVFWALESRAMRRHYSPGRAWKTSTPQRRPS